MTTITYTRPTGSPLTVNDTPETRALAAEQGWVEAGTKPAKEKPVTKEKPGK
jgi:hypothetical protein